jgi:hypothetical protein
MSLNDVPKNYFDSILEYKLFDILKKKSFVTKLLVCTFENSK